MPTTATETTRPATQATPVQYERSLADGLAVLSDGPTATTPHADPATDADSPALPAPAGLTWPELLAAVPGDTAFWAAKKFGGLLAPRGTSGEYPYAWLYRRGPGRWYRIDGDDNLTRIDGEDVPADVEVVDWLDQGHLAHELNKAVDRRADGEYVALAELADSLGETALFRDAVERLHGADPFALDPALYTRLTGADPVGEGEPEDDEDRLSGR